MGSGMKCNNKKEQVFVCFFFFFGEVSFSRYSTPFIGNVIIADARKDLVILFNRKVLKETQKVEADFQGNQRFILVVV